MFDILALFPGVPLFFMVSGFLITDSYFNSKTIKEYFFKRGLRIYPALFLNILILEFAMYIGGNMSDNNISFFEYIIYILGYMSTAVMGIGSTLIGLKGVDIYHFDAFFSFYPSGVLWTLAIELSFYLLLPFVLYFKKSYKVVILTILSFLSIYITFFIDYTQSENFNAIMKLLTISILPYFWIFAIGIFMRLFWKNIQKFFIGYGIYYLIIYLVFSSFMLYFTDTLGNYKTELYLSTIIQTILMAFAMFSMAFSYTHIKFNRKTDLSYSTYLYHMLIVQILIGFGVMNSWYLYFIVIGATFCIAYLSWTYIEKPMLKFKP
jgi:peptidoglycan/LPS O-acetylase OafA/YrhL